MIDSGKAASGPLNPIPWFDHPDPFPWQVEIYREFCSGVVREEQLYLPTGAGKTSIALLYLLALLEGAPLPRRLVYVVDRRAIVDQTRDRIAAWVRGIASQPALVERIEALAAFPPTDAGGPIPVGVLRGGTADSGEWRMDPARPSVIVGTVDMIGSRILFSGYGDGRSRRAMHAGLLGQDATVVLDESHLSVPMAELLASVRRMREAGGELACDGTFRVITMSATPSATGDGTRAWGDADEAHEGFRSRFRAVKRMRLHAVGRGGTALPDKIAEIAAGLRRGSVVVYVREVRHATRIHRTLVKATGDASRCALLTGTLRGRERQRLQDSPAWGRFAPSRERRGRAEGACYLVSTAAGEVGIDIDADHAVMDLEPIDVMVQRAGRVNRTGKLQRSNIHIIYAGPGAGRARRQRQQLDDARQATLGVLRKLEGMSPAQLGEAAMDEGWRRARSPRPRIAPIDRQRVEALSTTADPRRDLAVPLFLRGLDDADELPDAQVVWRWDIGRLLGAGEDYCRAALEAFPPLPDEVLGAPAHFVARELGKMARRLGELRVMVRGRDGRCWPRMIVGDSPLRSTEIEYGTVYVPAEAGGLTAEGLLSGSARGPVEDCGDDGDRVRSEVGATGSALDGDRDLECGVQIVLRVPITEPDVRREEAYEEEPERWLVYQKRSVSEMSLVSDEDQLTVLAARKQTLEEHGRAVAEAAERIARALALPRDLTTAVRTAGAWHDHGKADPVWQRAAGAKPGQPMAKSRAGQMNVRLLGGYRHEFGSVVEAERVLSSSAEGGAWLCDLTLHLVAAHHGHARPGFADRRHWGSVARDQESVAAACRVERRFDDLQRRLGPWSLAWLEAIVKAADAWVSAGYAIE